ncbi:AraC family transcriptional regulator [Pedobacter yulinensis]|uniref:AraC family transcriptional regulator n=1 Tax=Pedobacter yulinensis TaxID=2126353 RepID=A0A2T3HL04_9SPHI|nr:DUF6597 domain-containing transcriptional factor [Pedobacter yulinensis]PST83106.1 AraC family transcriptional regulator [Pedobacter yulinensis]
MDYQTFKPGQELAALVKYYWTLEVPAGYSSEKQRIVPDGCIELAFIMGDDIKRYVSETGFILQPRAMVLGQILEPFYIQPAGQVKTFAVRFYPHGFANFSATPIQDLANRETALARLFGRETADELTNEVIHAPGTPQRIEIIEAFLLRRLQDSTTVDRLVKSTVHTLLASKGSLPIQAVLGEDLSVRRQLERKFRKQIGLSPKQLGKVLRLQAALKLLLNRENDTLTRVAYESAYYDQNHFIKDFKEFTGTTPKYFLAAGELMLASVFYSKD